MQCSNILLYFLPKMQPWQPNTANGSGLTVNIQSQAPLLEFEP